MRLYKSLTAKSARLYGSLYFFSLGLVNLISTAIGGQLRPLDLILVVLSALPLLINNKTFSLMFGVVVGLVSLYMGFACLQFNMDPNPSTSQVAFVMGYLLSASLLFASSLLIYAGLPASDLKKLAVVV